MFVGSVVFVVTPLVSGLVDVVVGGVEVFGGDVTSFVAIILLSYWLVVSTTETLLPCDGLISLPLY